MVRVKKASAELELELGSKQEAETIWKALKPEECLPAAARCEVNLDLEGKTLRLRVNARDTPALRAALNSFLRWIIVARDAIKAGS